MKVHCILVLFGLVMLVSPARSGEVSFADSGDGSKLEGAFTNLSFGVTIPSTGYSTPPNSAGASISTGYDRYVRVKSTQGTMTLTAGGSTDTAMVSIIFANTTSTASVSNIGTSVGIVDSAGAATVYGTNSLKVAFVNSGLTARYGRLMYSTGSTTSYTDFTGRGSANDITLESGKWYKLVGYFRKTSTSNTWTLTARLINLTDNIVIDQLTQCGITHSATYAASTLLAGMSWNRSSALYSEKLTWAVEQCAYTSGLISFANSTDGAGLTGNITNLTFGSAIPADYSTPPHATGAYCTTGYSRYARVKSTEGTMTLAAGTPYDTAKVSLVFANKTTTSVTTGMGTSVGIVNAAGSTSIYSTDSLEVGFVNSGTTARYGRLMYSTTDTTSYVDFTGRSSANNITLDSGKWYKIEGYFCKMSTDDTWTVTARLLNVTDNVIVDEVVQEGVVHSGSYDAAAISAGLSWNRSSALYSEDFAWSVEQPTFSSHYAEILVDTDFTDWNTVPAASDRPCDGISFGPDMVEVKVANDESSLYYTIRTTGEFGGNPSVGDNACLYIDIDNNPATGTLVGPTGQQIGAEYTVSSNRRYNATSGAMTNGSLLYDGYIPVTGTATRFYGTRDISNRGGLAPWDIASGICQLEARVLLEDIGLNPGDTIAYTACTTRTGVEATIDWLSVARTYKIAPETCAVNPAPENGAKCAGGNTDLSWEAPLDVNSPSYQVYLGTNYNNVALANTGSAEYMTTTSNTSYAATLEDDTTYYWRVDVSDGNSLHKGKVWTFKTAIPAFPGAEGAGMWSAGGRGGDVYHVTNLNDTGAGSLRYGIENATGPRTIVFDVSGTIQLESNLTVDKPNITIAGQTAPGEGITLKKMRLGVSESDVIVRYLRSRPGDLIGACPEAEWIDCLSIFRRYGGTIRNIMIDHFSGSWSVGKVVDVISTVTDVTVQWSTLFEGLYDSVNPDGLHSMGFLFKPVMDGRMTFHHNVMAHNNARNPRIGTYDFYTSLLDFRNNVVYNYGGQVAGYAGIWNDGESSQMNYVENYVIAGNNSEGGIYVFKGYDIDHTLIYQSGAYVDGDKDGILDATDGGWNVFYSPAYQYFTKCDIEFPMLHAPISTQSAPNAMTVALETSGCTLPARDPVDSRVIGEIKTGTGARIDSQTEVGGWPTLYSLTAPTDTDQDGMPDYWENQYSLNSNDSSDGNDDNNSDGYTNLEEYLNNTDPVNNGSPIVYIAAYDSRASEADTTDTGKFIVTRTGSTSAALTVNLTISGTATNGTDYSTISSSVTIPAGASSATITVTPVDDQVNDDDEQVIIGVSSNANYKIGLPGQAMVVIADND